MKKTIYTEVSYVLGMILLALGTTLSELAGFGMSMIVAPAYIIHLAVSPALPFFTFGMAEYTIQALLIIIMMIYLKKFRIGYFFSFVTAVLYGLILDGSMFIFSPLATESIVIRIVYFIFGMILCSSGVTFFFKTYISPEAYELVVKEISHIRGIETHRFKTAYDIASCVTAIIMSFVFFGFGNFRGIGVGTVICAVLNGSIIGFMTKLVDSRFVFRDGLKMRHIFEK